MSRANGPRRHRRRGLFAPIALATVGLFWLGTALAVWSARDQRPQHAQARAQGQVHRARVERGRTMAASTPATVLWTLNPATGHAYAAIDRGTWAASESAAARLGGHLVTINDAAEQAWLLERFGAETPYWIGLTDAGSEGQWRWVTGEPLGYTNWGPEEPNDHGAGSEDYAHIEPKRGGAWNDLGPDSMQWPALTRAIIERSIPTRGIESRAVAPLPNPALREIDIMLRGRGDLEARRRVLYLAGPDAASTPVPITR